MKIYTKTGDKGLTSLYGGRRVSKADVRIEAYGTVDELNSYLGLLISELGAGHEQYQLLSDIQKLLFTIGSNLASDPEKGLPVPDVLSSDIEDLEKAMDAMNANLPALKSFILPGGSRESGYAHVCRTVTRRAERRVIALMDHEEVPEIIVRYLNRLSDYFFMLSRKITFDKGDEDIPWIPRK